MQLCHLFRWLAEQELSGYEQHLEKFLLHKSENESDQVVARTGEEIL